MKLHQKISLILFGLFLTIVVLEIGLRIGGFVILSMQEYRNLQSIKQKGSLRIMCLGESTTGGQYPPYLEEILNKRNIGIKFNVIDKGRGGINTEVILSELGYNVNKYQPDMVIAMMGCNDDRGIMYYKDIPEANTMIFKHCRVYRFMRLIYMHILNKLKKEGIYGLNDSSSDSAYMQLGRLYKVQGKFTESEQAFKKAIELNPNSESAYRELGGLYQSHGKFAEAEQVLKKGVELNPNSDSVYKRLSWLYREQRKFAESEQAVKKAIELNPNSAPAYKELAWLYKNQGKFAETEQAFNKVIELNPNSCSAYGELGGFYREQERFTESEQVFKKALELDPKNDSAYEGLTWLYRDRRKFPELEQVLNKAIKLNPNNQCLYKSLAAMYYDMGNNELSKIYAKKADDLRDKYYNPAMVHNYHMLKQILDARGIRLVCVQYPVRNIRPLKKIFKEDIGGTIIFVDNERIFKDAIRKEGYKEYFVDIFGGDFGHCTEKGNRLLAENIAQIILKEVFKK